MTDAQSRVLVALDVDTQSDAIAIARETAPFVGGVKVGLQLVNSAGLDIFDKLRDVGATRIFYDAKFHDIPNTVAGAVRAAARRGVWMVNVHASGGRAMMEAARDAAGVSGGAGPLLIGVTVLTSIDQTALNDELRVSGSVEEQVVQLARLAQASGMDGVVASPHEVPAIVHACGPQFVTVIPGVRPAGTDKGDQARIATPGDAIKNGAQYLVVGRAITAQADRAQAARAVAEEVADALKSMEK